MPFVSCTDNGPRKSNIVSKSGYVTAKIELNNLKSFTNSSNLPDSPPKSPLALRPITSQIEKCSNRFFDEKKKTKNGAISMTTKTLKNLFLIVDGWSLRRIELKIVKSLYKTYLFSSEFQT